MRRWWLLLVAVSACGSDPSGPPARALTFTTEVDASGLSPELTFDIPDATRSLTLVVRGDDAALYGLAAFALGDGIDLVQLPAGSPAAAMRASYLDEQVGQMPGGLFQSIRLGTFSHLYPYRPDQTVIAGAGHFQVASDRPGPVTVTVVMPEDNGARQLPLNLYIVSDTLADPNDAAFAGELARILRQADIAIAITGSERLTGTALERITDFNEPQESPTSQSAMVPALVSGRSTSGLDVFFVESLPTGVAGLSLGTPGPPLRDSYYFGVIVRGGFPAVEMARIVAHEAAHFLALQHVENRGVSGQRYPDPLDDTTPGVNNLMEDGTGLTPGQAFALSRSALLVAAP